ncbi:MAG: hypothetical protein NTX28_13245 [Novosphingobium sp.]|nr:hypothetical protein [Novosphingobium sp.]
MNDIPSNSIAAGNPARLIRSGIKTSEYGILEKESLESSEKFGELRVISDALSKRSREILSFIKAELGIESELLFQPVQDTPVDSFSLITLRSAIETKFRVTIPDEDWAGARTLAEIGLLPCLSADAAMQQLSLATEDPRTSQAPASQLPSSPSQRTATAALAKSDSPQPLAIRHPGYATAAYEVDMPQMALSGLSEAWMLKEMGNIHWKLICDFLQMPSSRIQDQAGERLYATFTRIRWECSGDLTDFSENDVLAADARLSRYGASFYFSRQSLESPTGNISADIMSTFAKHGERGANTSLVKGTPVLVQPEAIPYSEDFPDFGKGYRAERAFENDKFIYDTEYELIGPHDINGVGLLYFAAYPLIFDICTERFEGKGFSRAYSSVSKDLFYFANAEPDETLVFRMHERLAVDDSVTYVCSLSRKSDGKRMAQVRSVKRRLDR